MEDTTNPEIYWENLEKALVYVNKKRNIDTYLVVKHLITQKDISKNMSKDISKNTKESFIGFMERNIAEWLARNPEFMNEEYEEKVLKNDVIEEFRQGDEDTIDECISEVKSILVNDLKIELELLSLRKLTFLLNSNIEGIECILEETIFWGETFVKDGNTYSFGSVGNDFEMSKEIASLAFKEEEAKWGQFLPKLRKICYKLFTISNSKAVSGCPSQDKLYISFDFNGCVRVGFLDHFRFEYDYGCSVYWKPLPFVGKCKSIDGRDSVIRIKNFPKI